ncbi:MAG: hypothetical protein J6K53_11795 [Roseburia sp.]|nr:hypothetical protein [Roseburia sp.]
MNTIDVVINEVSLPIGCCVGFCVYIAWLIWGKDAGWSKIKSCIHKFGFIVIPYAGNGWKEKIKYGTGEVVIVFAFMWMEYEKLSPGAFILTAIIYYGLLNGYSSIVYKAVKDIPVMLTKVTMEVRTVAILPVVIFWGQECIRRTHYEGIAKIGSLLLLLVCLIGYLKFQYILICYVFRDYRFLNEHENENEGKLWILIAALLIDFFILCSGAYVIKRFWTGNINGNVEMLELIYGVISAFLTLEVNALKGCGSLAKVYNIFVVIAGIIMFSCFLGYLIGEKKVKADMKHEDGIKGKQATIKDEERKEAEEQIETEQCKPRFRKFPSSKLLMDLAIEEYQNEHNRTSVIDTKINIALPIIATYVFLVLDRMNISDYGNQIKNNGIMNTELQIGLLILIVLFAIVSMVFMFMTIKTNEYTILKVEDFYKPEYMALEEEMFCGAIIKYIIIASKQNKAVNDSRIKQYKMGLVMVGVSFLFYIFYMMT